MIIKERKIVIAGTRSYDDYSEAKAYIDEYVSSKCKGYDIIIVSGGCRGADLLGERYAIENGYEIIRCPAEWNRYGRGAGLVRNKKMAEMCDVLICFWNGKSKGSKSMIDYSRKLGKEVYVKMI